MQGKNATNVKKILMEIAEYKKVKGIQGLADYLEVKVNRLYAWINRNNIGDTSVLIKKIPNLRIEYLETGEGDMTKGAEIDDKLAFVMDLIEKAYQGKGLKEQNDYCDDLLKVVFRETK